MVALEHHHLQTPRSRWYAQYRRERIYRHRHDGRAEFWWLATVFVAAFWIAIGYGVYAVS